MEISFLFPRCSRSPFDLDGRVVEAARRPPPQYEEDVAVGREGGTMIPCSSRSCMTTDAGIIHISIGCLAVAVDPPEGHAGVHRRLVAGTWGEECSNQQQICLERSTCGGAHDDRSATTDEQENFAADDSCQPKHERACGVPC